MLAWHYTTGHCLDAIIATGFLRPATAGVPANERPVLWFSLQQDFEPTALKGIIADGVRRRATLDEMMIFGDGLARLGIEPRRLLRGEALRTRARIARPMWSALVAVAREQGADPADWCGYVGALPLSDLIVERRSVDVPEWTRINVVM